MIVLPFLHVCKSLSSMSVHKDASIVEINTESGLMKNPIPSYQKKKKNTKNLQKTSDI